MRIVYGLRLNVYSCKRGILAISPRRAVLKVALAGVDLTINLPGQIAVWRTKNRPKLGTADGTTNETPQTLVPQAFQRFIEQQTVQQTVQQAVQQAVHNIRRIRTKRTKTFVATAPIPAPLRGSRRSADGEGIVRYQMAAPRQVGLRSQDQRTAYRWKGIADRQATENHQSRTEAEWQPDKSQVPAR